VDLIVPEKGWGYGVFNTAELRGYGQPQYKTMSVGKEKRAT
jgi:hypothetical protein